MPELLTQAEGGDEEDNDSNDENDEDDDNDRGDKEDKAEGTADATPEELLLLVDAANGFNNLSRYGMLWTVRHRCPKMSRFMFNCYCHEIPLICRQPGGEVVTIMSKEGVT